MRLGTAGLVAAGLIAAALMGLAAPAVADDSVEGVVCPTSTVSIYFATGQVAISTQAQPLIVKLRDTIATCRPDVIALTARVDRVREGATAEAHAQQRLASLASELIASGLPADRILLSTLDGLTQSASDNQLHTVEIQFGKLGEPVEPQRSGASPAPTPPASVGSAISEI